MKNRHRVSQVVSKAYLLRGGRRKILKQSARIAANIAKLPDLLVERQNLTKPAPAACNLTDSS